MANAEKPPSPLNIGHTVGGIVGFCFAIDHNEGKPFEFEMFVQILVATLIMAGLVGLVFERVAEWWKSI